MPKLKKRKDNKSKKQREEGVVDLDITNSFDVENSEKVEEDFELDLDAATYEGRCGQAGNRQRS